VPPVMRIAGAMARKLFPCPKLRASKRPETEAIRIRTLPFGELQR
jgi:hypothetical protein